MVYLFNIYSLIKFSFLSLEILQRPQTVFKVLEISLFCSVNNTDFLD